ncbi:hypothetical protein SDC9_129455 [bioreactor metagenome]|uniref:Uncharacterized protein n=1 Tax=bioreactor metagenome TaxID=1076179 RepID=A0A645CZJ5_9ZZZZ
MCDIGGYSRCVIAGTCAAGRIFSGNLRSDLIEIFGIDSVVYIKCLKDSIDMRRTIAQVGIVIIDNQYIFKVFLKVLRFEFHTSEDQLVSKFWTQKFPEIPHGS